MVDFSKKYKRIQSDKIGAKETLLIHLTLDLTI